MSVKPIMMAALVVAAVAVPQAGQRKPQKPPEPPPIAPLVMSRLLDTYAAGRFDDAVREVAQAPERIGVNLRQHWSLEGLAWIDAVPAERSRRLLVAAALALETENLRVERGEWGYTNGEPPCTGTCVLDWAQARLVERGPADAAEQAWYLAAASLAGGVRDWRYLQRTVPPNAPPTALSGLTERALLRFPGNPQIRLEQAIAASGRFSTTVDGGRLVNDPGAMVITMGPGGRAMAAMPPREAAAAMLEALVPDPSSAPKPRHGSVTFAGCLERTTPRSDRSNKAPNAPPQIQTSGISPVFFSAGSHCRPANLTKRFLNFKPRCWLGPTRSRPRWRWGHWPCSAETPLRRMRRHARRSIIEIQMTIRGACFLYGHHPMLQSRIAALRAEVKR
jgi:hypothetical protein